MTVRAQRLCHDYGRIASLRDVDAEAAPKKITAVLGPNAAGKSTLLRLAIGALVPASGSVLVDGHPAHRMSARDLALRVAYVPQRPQVAAAFTVREVVELGRYALPASRPRVDAAIADLDLADVAGRPFPALSAGQQQRVTLARAVAQLAPDGNLVLDEPTSAMDLRHVMETMSLLRRLADGGATVLIAMHDLGLAAQIADDCWLLQDSRLVAAGPARQVMDLDRLRQVFGVGFEWIVRPGKPAALLAG
jgi:iron complex transport system ATP-binding protein